MTTIIYPELNVKHLMLIHNYLKVMGEAYLTDKSCKYPTEVKEILLKIIKNTPASKVEIKNNIENFAEVKNTKIIPKIELSEENFQKKLNLEIPNADNLAESLFNLEKELEDYKKGLDNSEEQNSAAHNTYYRLRMQVLEKKVDLTERISKLDEYAKFTALVLDVLEKELNPDSRESVLLQLKKLIN